MFAGTRLQFRNSMPRPLPAIGRRLPNGWSDALRQFALFGAAYCAYQLVRGLVDGQQALAFSNAWHIVHLERSLGAFFEPGLQQALLNHTWLIDFANFMYLNSHFILTSSFLIWLYSRRNENFYFVRNMFLVAMGLALIGYALYPTAPPRLLAGAGFTDTISTIAHQNQDSALASVLVNPYAAVPSMHIAFSLMIGVPGAVLCRSSAARAWWTAYPMLVFFVIVVTANHFWFDAACGAAVACMAAVAATQLGRLRPHAWAWREGRGEAPA
jgi:cytochrome bd-type quinol oxidase subunit 2